VLALNLLRYLVSEVFPKKSDSYSSRVPFGLLVKRVFFVLLLSAGGCDNGAEDRQKALALERQKMVAEAEKQRVLEAEKKKAAEAEKQKAAEVDKQKFDFEVEASKDGRLGSFLNWQLLALS